MKNTNIGIVNLIVSNKLNSSYFNNNLIEESKKIALDFFDVVKNSPILQLEFKVYNNLENKHIESDIAATRYIDNNIKLFEVYTIDEIDNERLKLKPFISDYKYPIDGDKMQLYFAIDNLIKESLSNYDEIDVDDIHESFDIVLNHIKTSKKVLVENVNIPDVEEDVIEIAVNKFNEKYESLNEDDSKLFKQLIESNDIEKEVLLESYKSEILEILEDVNKINEKEVITKSIKKIKEMIYRKNDVENDIISLHELKKDFNL